MKADIDRVTKLLTDTVMLLCKNGLTYDRELKIQGLLAITLDTADVFVVQISETFESPPAGQSNEKSVPNADKPSADKQASRKRVTPTTSRSSEEVVDLTRLPETPLAEPQLGHSRNANFQRHSLPPHTNNAPTMMRPPALPGTSSLQSSRGLGFPIGSCWPMGANQFLDVSGLNRFPNAMPHQNLGFGVRDETYGDLNSLHTPLSYWTNMRQPNPGGFHCPLPANKPSRDLSVPAPRWQHNSNFTLPNAVPNSQLRVMGQRHSSQRGLEKLSYATDAVPSFGGTAADGNFRIPLCAPRHRQPLQMTTVAPTLLPVERHTPQVESPNRCSSQLRDAGLSQFVVSCPAPNQSKISYPTAGAGGCSSFAGVTSSFSGVSSYAGRPSAPVAGSTVAPIIKPCLSPVPGSSNSGPLDLSDGVHSSTRNTGSTSAPLPGTDPSDQLTDSFQSTSGSVTRISELVNHISEAVNRGSRSVDRVCSPVIHVPKSATHGSLDQVCIPVNQVSLSADHVSNSVSHDSNLLNNSPETIPAYFVTIIPDDIDDINEQDSFPQNEDLPDVKMPVTSGGNECNAPETGRVTQEITDVLRQGVTQGSAHNLMPELSQGITHENMPEVTNEATTGLLINNDVQEPANHAVCLDSCPVTTGEDSEAGNAQVSDRFEEVTQQLETDNRAQNDIAEDLPVLTKVVPTETTNRKLAAGTDVLAMSASVHSSDSLKWMPKLQRSENWPSQFDEEQEEEETLMEETSLADPCTSSASTSVVDTRGSVDPVTCVVGCMQGTLDCVDATTGYATTEIHHPSGALDHEIASGALDHPSKAENLTSVSSDNFTRVPKQPLLLESPSKALTHTLSSTASVHPPEVMDKLMIESRKPSEALLCPSGCSGPPLMELIDSSDILPLPTTVFSCKSKDCPMTYNIASDLAFHYIYQHPELIANDLISGNRKSRKCPITRNAYAKSLRASTASKREYSEQTRGLRDPSLVHPCATTGKFVHHRPKHFPCPKVGCTKKYSCEKRLVNHLQISHRKHSSNLRQLNSSNLQSVSEMDSSIGSDNLGVNSDQRLDDSNFLCPKAGCTKKYSSEKRLSNHLWICHREYPANLGQMNSSNLQSDSEMDSSIGCDNLGVNYSQRLDDGNFLCPKAGCAKKYSSEKRLSNHLWICHHIYPAKLRQVNSSNLQSESKIDSSIAAGNLEANNSDKLDNSEMSCGRDSDLVKMVEQSSSENQSYGKV